MWISFWSTGMLMKNYYYSIIPKNVLNDFVTI